MAECLFRVGISGHRDLDPDYIPHVQGLVRETLEGLIAQHSRSRVIVVSSLAAGADQLCACVGLELGCSLVAPLPLDAADYRMDFDAGELRRFDRLVELAQQVLVVQPQEPLPIRIHRGYHYRQAGLWVARQCDMLLALWNGDKTLQPEGGGTYETVQFFRRAGKPVWQINAPRLSGAGSGTPLGCGWYEGA